MNSMTSKHGRLRKVLGSCSIVKISATTIFFIAVIGIVHLASSERIRRPSAVELHPDGLGFSLLKSKTAVRFSQPSKQLSVDCLDHRRHPKGELCRRWGSSARLQVERIPPPKRARPRGAAFKDPACHRISMGTAGDPAVTNCIDLGSARWYGGHESYLQQRWPINTMQLDNAPYVSGLVDPNGAVLERYWISSDGLGVFVNESVPLFYSLNTSMICFTADPNSFPYDQTPDAPAVLEYILCEATDLRSMHLYALANWIPHPSDVPDLLMMRRPIWSTWVSYSQGVTQQDVLDFATKIKANNFTASQIEIDDNWETGYGDMRFNGAKFPDPKGMVGVLHALGFRATLWVHPFVNLDTDTFRQHYRDDVWLKTVEGLPAVVSWWDGLALTVDFTNEKGMAWHADRLRNLSAMGIDGFKFDSGEVRFFPHQFRLANANGTPNTYAKQYAVLAASLGPLPTEIRVGAHSQDVPLFVRILDRDSSWSENNGLRSIIPTMLTFSILGYPFILPDMIGGNGASLRLKRQHLETGKTTGKSYRRFQFPSRQKTRDDYFKAHLDRVEHVGLTTELFLRWVQLTAFLPAMQFSIPPWSFDNETVATCQRFVALHETFVFPIVQELAVQAKETGVPIIRPLWWLDPTDPVTFDISDQFLVGDSLLVAPIVYEGTDQRDIYLPRVNGTWKDHLYMQNIPGPVWIRNYTVPLDEIAYFTVEQ